MPEELLPQFKKTFLFNWCPPWWQSRFFNLTHLQQKAFIALINMGTPRPNAYKAVWKTYQENPDAFLLRFDETVQAIYNEDGLANWGL